MRNLSENQRAEYRKLKEAIQRREETSKAESATRSDSDVSFPDKALFTLLVRVKSTVDIFNTSSKQYNSIAFNQFLKTVKNGDLTGKCEQILKVAQYVLAPLGVPVVLFVYCK